MKLKERTWNDKNTGDKRNSYTIGKINEFGEGIVADTEYSIVLSFDAKVRKQPWTDPAGVQKIIVSLNVTGKITPDFENVQYNEYGSASFQLSEKLAELLGTAVKGDTVFFALKSFDGLDARTKKITRKTAWIGAINQHVDLTQRKAGGIKFPVKAKTDVLTVSPNEYATDIKAVIQFCLSDSASFKESFGVSLPTDKPQAFIDWMKGNSEVTTKLDDGQLIVLYWEIVNMIK